MKYTYMKDISKANGRLDLGYWNNFKHYHTDQIISKKEEKFKLNQQNW